MFLQHKSIKLAIAAGLMVAASLSAKAQASNATISQFVNKTWYILAMKCQDEVKAGGGKGKDKYMQYYFSLMLKPANPNNLAYGTYSKMSTDMDTNPNQEGKYAIRNDETGHPVLTLTNMKNQSTEYSFKVLDENHLTLYRLSESNEDRCRTHYAIAP